MIQTSNEENAAISPEDAERIAAWWLARVPENLLDSTVLGTLPSAETYSPRQIAEQMRSRTEFGLKFAHSVIGEYKAGATGAEKMEDKTEQKDEKEETTVYVGRKEPLDYAAFAVSMFNSGATKITIRARGLNIPKAVTAAEIVRKKLRADSRMSDIRIDTEEFVGEGGRNSRVSVIEIDLELPASTQVT